MLYFAYGSNMFRAVMNKHAPAAEAVGVAELADHRFIITSNGYASVEPSPAQTVYGVLWRITPRDRVTLDSWENVATGLYRAEMLPVSRDGQHLKAVVYVAPPSGEGSPKAGYMELVIAAAREWNIPQAYISSLQHWLPAHPTGTAANKISEFRWM